MSESSRVSAVLAAPIDHLPVPVPAPVRARHVHLQDDLAQGLWKDAPALSWLMNPKDGRLHFRATHAGDAAEPAAVSVHHEVLAGTLLRRVQQGGPQPLRSLEVLPAADGTLHHFLIVGFPIKGIDGLSHPYLAGVAIDITHQKLRVDELAQQALLDELTGLYNLRGFYLFAEHELKVARRRGTPSAIIYVDVDGLKEVNDTRGHSEGNALLVTTAALLRDVFRECDVIGRLGGDEFAVFAADVKGDPQRLKDRLSARLDEAGPAGVSVSIGVATCLAENRIPLTDLLVSADNAMYKDKFERAQRSAGANGAGRHEGQ